MILFVWFAVAHSNSFSVSSLPGFAAPIEGQLAGYIPVNDTCPASLFFWSVDPAETTQTTPVVVWLNGGPGSSSFLGWFAEGIGPFHIDAGGRTLNVAPYSWTHANATIVMIDQPAGVGLSSTKSAACLPRNVAQSTLQLAHAVQWLMARFFFGRPLFIAGESYAGSWIPNLAVALLQQGLPPHGVLIGDGWINPAVQQGTYAQYAYTHGLISSDQVAEIDTLYAACLSAIKADIATADPVCERVEGGVVNMSNANVYDVRLTGDYDFSIIGTYLNQKEVLSALHVSPDTTWMPGSDAIADLFAADEQNSYASLLPVLLEANVPVLLYNGVFDMDCNFLGIDAVLEELGYFGKKGPPRTPWRDGDGKHLGSIRRALGGVPLVQVLVSGAGHLVPMDAPASALYMLKEFLAGRL